MRRPQLRLRRPGITVPKLVVKRKVITLALPKIDAAPLRRDTGQFLWRIVPKSIKLWIERYLHARTVQQRLGEKATQEYIDLDWALAGKSPEQQHLLCATFLDLGIEKTGGFTGPVAKYDPIRPHSAVLRGERVIVKDDGSLEKVK